MPQQAEDRVEELIFESLPAELSGNADVSPNPVARREFKPVISQD
jgi:hypothetical protein